MSRDENGTLRPTHERLLKAEYSLVRLVNTNSLFTYLNIETERPVASIRTNNRIEGGVNAQLRDVLRSHRGLSLMRRIKAVFWWCYMHSPKPLSPSELLRVMPTDESNSEIYKSMRDEVRYRRTIPTWGDAILWRELHNYDKFHNNSWD